MARKTGLFLLVLLLFLGGLFGAALSVKETIATALLNWAVDKSGISLKHIPIQSIAMDRVILGPVTTRDGSLTFSKITLQYSLVALLAGTLDRLEAEGVFIELSANSSGVNLPFLNSFPTAENTGEALPILPLPFKAFRVLGNLQLKYEGVREPFDVSVDLNGRQTVNGYSVALKADSQTLGCKIDSEILLSEKNIGSETLLTLKSFKPSIFVGALPIKGAVTGESVIRINGPIAGLFGKIPLSSQHFKLVRSELSIPTLQFDRMNISNVKLNSSGEGSLDSFAGQWDIAAKLKGGFVGGEIAETAFKAKGRVELKGQAHRLEAFVPGFPFALTLDRTGKDENLSLSGGTPSVDAIVEWRGQQAKIKGKYLGGGLKKGIVPAQITFGEGAFDLVVGGEGQLSAKFSVSGAKAHWAKTFPVKKNLTLNAVGNISGERDLIVKGEVHADQAIRMPFSLKHNISLADGRIVFSIPSTVFIPKGLQPSNFLRGMEGIISSVEGGVSGEGRIAWGQKESSRLLLHMENIGFHTAVAKLAGLNATIDFNGLFPLATAKKQTITASLVDVGIPFTDLAAVFDLSPDGIISIEELIWPFAGGVFNLGGASFDLKKQRHNLKVDVIGVRLDELSKTVNLEGLSGTGRISGTFPLLMEGGSLFVDGAELSSREKGVLKYLAPATGGALKAAGENTNLLVKALENFHYDVLALKLNGDLARDVEVRVELAGNNPELYDGYPLRLNFTISGALGDMIRKGMIGMDIPESVKRKLQSRH